ncbi:Tetratricopeptide-like helical domain-containing protein [Dioscorea alata]|uniref:Tetratricopeptide-like helical domain-containing protein n=3 Tax=Dioscorea alata TaxID=55571 RepID=A0ACB7UHQ8_DIOAL|nr:Tetratricopeptide-like helical domain-containing protein [Dioscorea alata]KAH7659865.1 Tetratricopeptide-like helical domain-containing protein [Dioscorea alata]KAH7659866.1 Tetratricopeptide-like helical domain-containing protein [Dioscorea alata]
MIWVLGKHERFDLAWRVVRRMYRRSILNRDAIVVLMERYAAANEPSKAIKTFHALEKFKIAADSTVFYALLSALCKNKNVEEAEELLLVNRKFYPLEAESFNIILDGWCNIIVDIVEAKRVWREMSNCCITPDGTSYTHMISCFSKVGNLFDSLRLYDEMKKRGWVPSLVVYNALIYVLAKENCLKEAHNIFDKIKQEGLEPDVGTYNSMIYPLCENQRLEEAHQVMDEMIERNITPIIETYHAFAKGDSINCTLRLIKKMSDVGCGPNSCTFSLILNKFIRMNECGNALRMWTEMRRYNVIPDSSHYTHLIEGLIQHGWIPKALEFYDEMKSKGFPNDPKFEKIFQKFITNHKNHWGKGKEYVTRPRPKNTVLERVRIY